MCMVTTSIVGVADDARLSGLVPIPTCLEATANVLRHSGIVAQNVGQRV